MILLRLHFISLSCMIYTIVYTFDIFLDYIFIAGTVDTEL